MTGPGSSVASAVARRLVVLFVADVLAPRGALALLAGFRQREVREQPVGCGAVPMLRVGRDVDRVARTQDLRLLAFVADAADTAQAIERLADGVRVPGGARARREGDDVPPMRDGALAVSTGSWNTTPVKVSAAPRLVCRSGGADLLRLLLASFSPLSKRVARSYRRKPGEQQRRHARGREAASEISMCPHRQRDGGAMRAGARRRQRAARLRRIE